MNQLYFIRHGMTAGNELRRYIGRTDQPLSEAGIRSLQGKAVPPVGRIAVSPMLRCIQTAEILFPGREYEFVKDFRECDFGTFEGKNYRELAADPAYQAWIDSNGTSAFPGGEDPAEFRKRCAEAFYKFVTSLADGVAAALVVHGGTIMSVLAAYDRAHRDFYEYSLPNGQGIEAKWDGGALTAGHLLW